MSQQKVLEKDPVGYQDWTLPVSIVGQVIEKLKVDIVAQTLANLKVDVAAQSLAELNVKLVASEVTLNVAITSSSVTLDVNIVSQAATLKVSIESSLATLDVNIASSAVTLNVAIQSSDVTLDVNVTNASLTVNIGAPLTDTGYLASSIVESVQLDVNIAASAVTLNVAITSSSVTLDVNVTNASLTVNIGGPLTDTGYVATSVVESVQLDVNIAASAVTLNVAITSSSVTLDVNVTNASLTVNIGGPLTTGGYVASEIVKSVQLDVNIAASAVTLNVAITSSSVTLDVNVTNASLTVNIGGPLTTSGYVASEIVKSVQLDVNIAASAVTLNVAIKSSDVTIDVNVTNASLTVNIGGPLSTSGYVQTSIMESVQLDVNIAASAVTLNVAIKSSDVTLNVNVTNASLTVNIGGPVDANGYVQTHIMDSVQLDVNIAASAVTLNVAIQSSAVTLDVNIASSAVTLNVAIQSSAVTLDVNIASSAVTLDINVTNPVLQVGQTKPALSFDGVDDCVEVPDSASLDISGPFTLEFYFRGKLSNDKWMVVDKGVASGNSWYFYTDRSSNIYNALVIYLADTRYTMPLGDILADDTWYHIVFTVDSSGVKGYVNGELKQSWSEPTQVDVNDYPVLIGKYAGGGFQFEGEISFVRIYSRALSQTEVQRNYQNPQAPVTNGLVMWLNFDEGSGTTAHDKSGNGNDGTIYGATWVSEAGEVPALVNVNLSAQTVTMEVKIVASDVTLNVAIQSSAVTLDVNITGSSVTLDVNIASSSATLNVQITGSTVTLNVNVVGTANVNITDAIVNISALKLMDTGTPLVKTASGTGTITLYTVPAGKKAYLYYAQLTAKFTGTSGQEGRAYLELYDGTNTYPLIRLWVNANNPCMTDSEAFTICRIPAGWEVRLATAGYAGGYATVTLVEMPA